MTSEVNNGYLRTLHPRDQAKYFQQLLRKTHWKLLWDYLLANVGSGALPAPMIHVFLAVTKEPLAVVEALRQRQSVLGRYLAIRRFGRCVRSEATFAPIWEAVGGTQGLMDLMAEMSVNHVKVLCAIIGASSTATGARSQRQQAMTELLRALLNHNGHDDTVPTNPDKRPLRAVYDMILPACNSDLVMEFSSGKCPPKFRTCEVHREAYQERCLNAVFPEKGRGDSISPHNFIIHRNIAFSFDVLNRFVTDKGHLEANVPNFFSAVAYPLARQLCNRRAQDEVQLRFYDLILKCIDMVPRTADYIDLQFVGRAVQAWKRARNSRGQMEQIVASLIGFVNTVLCSLVEISQLMSKVGPALRLPLLKLFLRNSRRYKFEVDPFCDEGIAQLKSVDQLWETRIFSLFPSGDALHVLNCLRKAHVDGKFISESMYYTKTVMGNSVFDQGFHGDPDMLAALLHSRHYRVSRFGSSVLDATKRILKQRRKKAMISRDPETRADWARSVIYLSIASGSLEIYEEMILWSRRFNRDVQTTNVLYDADTILTEEGIELLSAISPKTFTDDSQLESLKARIEKANQIILHYVQTATMLLREPSIGPSDLYDLLSLPARVASCRISQIDSQEDTLFMTEDVVTDLVWGPTVDMIIEIETIVLKKRLEFGDRGQSHGLLGILKDDYFAVVAKRNGRRFLDILGKARDKMWQEYRPTVHPAILAIGEPWPKGLPIQCLCPPTQGFFQGMDYLQSRAQAIVFPKGQSVLLPIPTDVEAQAAIGPFVDNYAFALQVYVNSVEDSDTQRQRVVQAYNHALAELNGSRMSPDEAIWFWKRIYDATPGVNLPSSAHRAFKWSDPDLPVNDGLDPSEWNPDPNSPRRRTAKSFQSREIAQSCLDSMLTPYTSSGEWSQADIDTSFETFSLQTVAPMTPPSLWTLHRYPLRLKPSIQDALTASAITFINARCGSNSSILLQPFPSAEDVRIPALYLDQEFLDEESGRKWTDHPALESLAHLSAAVPTHLLEQLAYSLMGRLGAGGENDECVLKATVDIIKRLSRSDRPALACPLVRHMILSRRDDSSWHRHLLKVKFLNHLSAQEANEFFQSFSTEAREKSQNQTSRAPYSPGTESKPTEEGYSAEDSNAKVDISGEHIEEQAALAPLIKITTLKMIPQMLRRAQFTDRGLSLQILVDLLKSASHPDICIAVVESMLAMYSDTDDEILELAVLDILSANIVPIAASANERLGLTEAEWADAEGGTCKLPDVYDDESLVTTEHPPIMKRLVDAIPKTTKSYNASQARKLELWMRRIILPMVEQSALNHRRWTSIFLRQNGFYLSAHELPLIPFRPSLMAQLFEKYPKYFEPSTVQTIRDLVMVHFASPENMAAVSRAIDDNPDLLHSKAGQHWISVWTEKKAIEFALGLRESANVLTLPPEEAPSEAVVSKIQQMMVDVANMSLFDSDPKYYELVFSLTGCYSVGTQGALQSWIKNCLPLLEGFNDSIVSLRTDKWQRDPARQPTILPKTHRIKAAITMTRYWTPAPMPLPLGNADSIVADITALLCEITSDGRPYHTALEDIKAEIQIRMRTMRVDGFRVALGLGSVDGLQEAGLSLVDHLRLDISALLVSLAYRSWNTDEIKQVIAMLERWKQSYDENIRDLGQKTLSMLEEHV
ncbi:hypothetical protein F5Y15DRAFT_376780 [Xylariaceae sp. FL0016]|nr:hypothetical protein F5Y15DRAFT_376780 [Xylariaceae sp. FL0016]